jgi:hypothetical protein
MQTGRSISFRGASTAVAALLAAALAALLPLPPAGAAGHVAGIPAAEARLRAAATRAGLHFPLRAVSIRVEKAARRLTLSAEGRPLRAYRVGLGFAPVGEKRREGDGRTPEGSYWICSGNARSRFHLFLGLSYPGKDDAARGLADGLIGPRTAARILAVRPPAAPSWSTALGGAVGLHGGGSGSDWTLGCIALENEDVDEVWAATHRGTPVEIVP